MSKLYLNDTGLTTLASEIKSYVDNNSNKVSNTLATTTKAYLTGTTSATTNIGTQVFDTGVYLGTTAGSLYATTFYGALSGNASTATTATTATKVTATGATTTKAYILGVTASGTTPLYDTGVYLGTTAGNLVATTFTGSLSGNATTATTLATARTIQINLASTSAVSFNGSENITPGVTGTLGIANGGTGTTTGHISISTSTDTTSTEALSYSGTFTVIDSVTRDSYGHVTKINTKTLTLPVSNAKTVSLITTDSTSATTYYTPFSTGSGTTLRINDGYKYITLQGTTSAVGYGQLQLGNATASGTAGNKYGVISIYGTDAYYWRIIGNKAATANRDFYLPNATSGTSLVAAVNNTQVGSGVIPVYVSSAGQVTASSSTVGSTTQPVYMNSGTISAMTGALSTTYGGTGNTTGTATYTTTTADTSSTLYPLGVTSAATTTLKRDTSITMSGGIITATTFSGALSGNATTATTATNIILTETNPTSSTSYYMPFSTGSGTTALYNDGITYSTKEGTTSAVGYGSLTIGNSIASGTAGNKYGELTICGTDSYGWTISGEETSNGYRLYLPRYSGRLIAAQMSSKEIGSSTNPVYVTSYGRVLPCDTSLDVDITGTATTAITTEDTTHILHPIGVTGDDTTALKRDTSITMTGGKLSAQSLSVGLSQSDNLLSGVAISGHPSYSVTTGMKKVDVTTSDVVIYDEDYDLEGVDGTQVSGNTYSDSYNNLELYFSPQHWSVEGYTYQYSISYICNNSNDTIIVSCDAGDGTEISPGEKHVFLDHWTGDGENAPYISIKSSTVYDYDGDYKYYSSYDFTYYNISIIEYSIIEDNEAEFYGAVNCNDNLTVTGTLYQPNLTLNDGVTYRTVISAYDDGDDYNYGSEVTIGGYGNTFIGAGESHTALRTALQSGTSTGEAYDLTSEHMYVTADSNIYFYSACNTISSRAGIVYDSSGNLRPLVSGTRSLGTSSYYWNTAYITTMNGTSTKATTTADTSNTLYLVGVTSSATTTLKRDTSITMTGGSMTLSGDINIQNDSTIYCKDSSGTYRTGIRLDSDNYYQIAVCAVTNRIYIGSESYTEYLMLRGEVVRAYGEFYCYGWGNTSFRKPVQAASTDGNQVVYMSSKVNSSGTYYVTINGQFGTTGSTYSNYNFTSTSSDIRLKTNIEDTKIEAMPIIRQMQMRQFDWIDNGIHQDLGFVADELELLDTSLTIGGGYDENGEMDIKSINILPLISYVVKGVQELDTNITTIYDRISELETQLNAAYLEIEELQNKSK